MSVNVGCCSLTCCDINILFHKIKEQGFIKYIYIHKYFKYFVETNGIHFYEGYVDD